MTHSYLEIRIDSKNLIKHQDKIFELLKLLEDKEEKEKKKTVVTGFAIKKKKKKKD